MVKPLVERALNYNMVLGCLVTPQVKPFDSGDARRILREQLGKPLGEIFRDADTAFETPVAAASLGQVRTPGRAKIARKRTPPCERYGKAERQFPRIAAWPPIPEGTGERTTEAASEPVLPDVRRVHHAYREDSPRASRRRVVANYTKIEIFEWRRSKYT